MISIGRGDVMKPIKLSVHKNTREQRQRHEVKDQFRSAVRRVLRNTGSDLLGFSITTISTTGTKTNFVLPPTVPTNLMGEFIKRDIEREVGLADARQMLAPESEQDD